MRGLSRGFRLWRDPLAFSLLKHVEVALLSDLSEVATDGTAGSQVWAFIGSHPYPANVFGMD